MAACAAACLLGSCKKENTAATKDYAFLIKDKTWWGSLTNAGGSPQYYSAHFNADNTVLWGQLSGDYSGHWAVDSNKLTLRFSSPDVTVTAIITHDNR